MSKVKLFRRGSAEEDASFVGGFSEITVVEDKKNLRIHDSIKSGGYSLPNELDVVAMFLGTTSDKILYTDDESGSALQEILYLVDQETGEVWEKNPLVPNAAVLASFANGELTTTAEETFTCTAVELQASGPQGAQGPQGANGAQGSQGSVGAQGGPGSDGAQGAQGSQGAQGADGPNGTDGNDGADGNEGAQGPAGAKGDKGDTGAQGSQGAQGAQGVEGNPGMDGLNGDVGAQGAQGSQGPAGNDGTDGAQGLDGGAAEATVNAQTGTTYTLQASDLGKIVTLDNASTITLTVPVLTAGFHCTLIQKGAGQVIVSASGTTINNRQGDDRTAGQLAITSLIYSEATVVYFTGDTGQA